VPVELWHRVIQVNLFGTYHGIRAVLPWMREQGHGRIINLSSVLGKLSSPQQSAYVASKHAIRALSNSTRQEVQDLPGLSVCTILPGPIDTPLFQHAANYSGRRVKPIKPVIDARRVAESIVSAATNQRREVFVGASTGTNLAFGRLAPGLVEKLAARQVAKDHFEPAPAPVSQGNLMRPDHEHTRISGGWDRAGHQLGDEADQAVSNNGHRSAAKTLTTLATVGLAGAAGVTAWKAKHQ
jgi:NAD(P)-dependent dehydrogenase (short-subunit alcohol dehydrogenase family)